MACKSDYYSLPEGYTPVCERFKLGRKIAPRVLYKGTDGTVMVRGFIDDATLTDYIELGRRCVADGLADVRVCDIFDDHLRLLWNEQIERDCWK